VTTLLKMIESMPDAPRNVKQAMDAAAQASHPADVAKFLFIAVLHQQTHIEQLELAAGLQDGQAVEGIRRRAAQIRDSRSNLTRVVGDDGQPFE
jgi:hypothetical protein